MDVRRAAASEAAILSRLNRHVQQLHADAAPRLFKQPGEGIGAPVFAEFIARPDTHVLIGYADGEPVGYVIAQVVHRPEHPFRHALDLVYVDQIAVDPAHRRRGYGARLLREAVALAQAAGIRRVELDVWAFNTGARRFFAGQGFGVFNERMELETGSDE